MYEIFLECAAAGTISKQVMKSAEVKRYWWRSRGDFIHDLVIHEKIYMNNF